MLKFFLILLAVAVIAIGAEYFGLVDIPWVDIPQYQTEYRSGKMDDVVRKVDE